MRHTICAAFAALLLCGFASASRADAILYGEPATAEAQTAADDQAGGEKQLAAEEQAAEAQAAADKLELVEKQATAGDPALALQHVAGAPTAALELFLDHLMRAESSGRDFAANPRSTALGAFQFIKSTFVAVARQHFAAEVAELSDDGLLGLRTNRHFARRAAAAYSKENAAYLHEQGIRATFAHLRLAFLVGAGGAAKVIKAAPQATVSSVLSDAAIRANPFMKSMTAADLIAKTRRDIGFRLAVAEAKPSVAGTDEARPEAGRARARCKQGLAACRRFVALQGKSRAPKATAAARKSQGKGV